QTFPAASHAPFAVLTQTLPWNIPLIYSGQEEPVLRALPFFEKDSIHWKHFARAPFYKTLLALRKRNPALDADASFKKITAGDNRAVYAFVRKKLARSVVVVLNLSPAPQPVQLNLPTPASGYDVFKHQNVNLNGTKFTLGPWEYRVYEFGPTRLKENP
ncbi:MAG TPA: alpha-glucosidase C-terminal domain-containing protein, partial [Puia sp.]|nr:alpha-glucosidase C-terminal domain-containing protein [Puia sp.]